MPPRLLQGLFRFRQLVGSAIGSSCVATSTGRCGVVVSMDVRCASLAFVVVVPAFVPSGESIERGSIVDSFVVVALGKSFDRGCCSFGVFFDFGGAVTNEERIVRLTVSIRMKSRRTAK